MTHINSANAAPETSLKVGVVGCGARASLAIISQRPENGGVITAVCDPHPDIKRRVHTQINLDPSTLTLTSSIKEILATDIDVAFVTSPDNTHAEITKTILEAGVAVYLEKPLAITLPSATEIIETAFRTKTPLYVGHNMRHMSVVKAMRQLILDGRIGEVKAIWCRHFVGNGGDYYFKDWHATREFGTGLLIQKAAHDIDVIHWLSGAYTTDVVAMGALSVYGQVQDRKDHSHELMPDWFSLNNWPPLAQTGLNPIIDVEDISMMLMKLTNGIYASYQQCHFTPDYWRNYTVIGTEGRLENFGDGEGGQIKLWNRRSNYNPQGDLTFPILGDAHGHDDADILTVREFFQFVRNGARTETNPISAWYAVAAGIQATASLRNRNIPMHINKPSSELLEYFINNQHRHQDRQPK